MQIILSFFLLFSIIPRIISNYNNVTKQEKVDSKFKLKYNLGRTWDESGFTKKMNGSRNEIDVTEVTVAENKHEEKNCNRSLELPPRKSRDSLRATRNQEMECVACYSGISTPNENCFSGVSSQAVKCADYEECFTELHPQYIKRGCMLRTAINRTFVCKCPLCNDKPSEDPTYYEYSTISDWIYDNERLQQPVVGMDLFCKVCETMGRNSTLDKICKIGSSADYVFCTHKELCFTNIDLLGDKVSRGCIKPPAYNSMHFFCNVSLCNNKAYENPARYRKDLFHYRVSPVTQVSARSDSSTAAVTAYENLLAIFLLHLFYFITESGICQN